MDSLRNELYVWEVNPRVDPPSEPPRSALPPLRTPTEEAGPSPTGLLGVPVQQTMTQPGLPTPRADVSSQQPLTQQGNAVNQGQNTGGLGINAGAGQCAQGGGRSDAGVGGDAALSPLFGRGGARADRAVGGEGDGQVGPSRPQGQDLGTNVQTSSTNAQNSSVNA